MDAFDYAAMERMFAYGQPHARLWSVGLEEHCREDELPRRIALRSASDEYISLEDFHRRLFSEAPENVSVWDVTLQIYERLFGRTTTLGGLDPRTSDVLLAEILPLPRPQHDHWPKAYHAWWPKGPASYLEATLPRMAARLVERADEYKPKVVLLHGKTQHRRWAKRLGGRWTKYRLGSKPNETAELLRREETAWVLTNNFVNNGWIAWSDQHIDALVAAIREMCEGA